MATPAKALAPLAYRCSFPGCPNPVSIHISLIEAFQGIVRDEEGDRQGILYGEVADVGTTVERNLPLAGFSLGEMCVTLGETSTSVVGYYRIREGASLQLTAEEVAIAESVFVRPGSVVLLIERRGGFPAANFFFSQDGELLNVPLLEFPLDAAALMEREAQRVKRADERVVSDLADLPVTDSASTSDAPPAGGETEERDPRRSRFRRPLLVFSIVALAAVAAAGAFFAAQYIYRPHDTLPEASNAVKLAPGTPLRAERQGDDLKISWDLNSPAIARATSGLLDILDGSANRRVRLSVDQVRFGSVLYSPDSDQISVRLTTFENDRATDEQSVLVLLKRPAAAPAAAKDHPAARAPFEVSTQRAAPPPSSGPAGTNPVQVLVESRDLPPFEVQRVELPPPAPVSSVVPAPPTTGALPGGQSRPAIKQPPAPEKSGSAGGSPTAIGAANPNTAASAPHVDSAAPASGKPASGPSGTNGGDSPKPPVQATAHVDPPGRSGPSSAAPPATAANNPSKPAEEPFVAPVLIAQQGVHMPPELRDVFRQPVSVKVRVDVNENGRVTKAEGIPEKGTPTLLLTAATDAALWCRFQPARRGNKAVPSTVTILFRVDPDFR